MRLKLCAREGILRSRVPNNEAVIGERSGAPWFYADIGRHVNFFTAKSLAQAIRSVDLRSR